MDSFVTADGCSISYNHFARAGKPTVVFSSSLGTTSAMWAAQIEALCEDYSVVSYDMRGHGQSEVPNGSYSIDRLGMDVIDLIDHLNLEQVFFCGLSIGGMIGQWLGARYPKRLEKLVLANTSAYIGPPENWQGRIETVRTLGLESIWPAVVERWFSSDFIKAEGERVNQLRASFISNDPNGYIGCCAAIRDADLRVLKPSVDLSTLIIAGSQDLATPPEQSYVLAKNGSLSSVVELDAGHLSNIECAQEFNQLLVEFFGR